MFKDEPNRVSSLFAVQPRLGASAWTGTVRDCGACARQNGARAAEQDEEAAPAEQDIDSTYAGMPRERKSTSVNNRVSPQSLFATV